MLKISRIIETCLYVKDLDITSTFYHDKLGLEVIAVSENRHVFFRAGNSVLLCFIAETTGKITELPPHGATGIIHFAFEIENGSYDKALTHIREMSIEVVHEQSWKNGIRSFYFHDPDGHLVEILEQGLWNP